MGKTHVGRLHAIDACQLSNLDRQFKYAQSSVARLRDLAAACTAPAATRVQLFSWLVFNLLVGNADAHLKNLSFLVDANGIRPAPHYDLVAHAVYHIRPHDKDPWPRTRLAWPVGDAESFDRIDRACAIAAGVGLGLSTETANRLLDAQLNSIPKAAKAVLARTEADNERMQVARPALARMFASELETIHSIVAVIIVDMVSKLCA
jgi:serine/threonine-protein kinase HipA